MRISDWSSDVCSSDLHGMNASTFTARVIASTGADVAAALSGAVGAMSGPLHGGAPSRVLGMIEEIERTGDADAYEIGRASCRERVCQRVDLGGRRFIKKKNKQKTTNKL